MLSVSTACSGGSGGGTAARTRSSSGSTGDASGTSTSGTSSTTPKVIPPITTAPVGALPGSGGVDDSGNATYAVRLEVPPGPRGMQPELALVYSSAAGNGLLGAGFHLQGLTAIHRCAKTLADDDEVAALALGKGGKADALCLDGMRLVPLQGSAGASGTVYGTRVGNRARIVAHGATEDTDGYFVVENGDGIVLEYGRTPDARVQQRRPAGAPPALGTRANVAWYLSRATDLYGNAIAWTYASEIAGETTQDHRPLEIRYGLGRDGSATRSVRFRYERRPDIRRGFSLGAPRDNLLRMARIETFAPGGLVSTFWLTYQPDQPRSRIASLERCAADGVCMPKTELGWSNGGEPAYDDETPELDHTPFPINLPDPPDADTVGCDEGQLDNYVAVEPDQLMAAPTCPVASGDPDELFDAKRWVRFSAKTGMTQFLFPQVARLHQMRQNYVVEPARFFHSRIGMAPAAVQANNDPHGDLIEPIAYGDEFTDLSSWGLHVAKGFVTRLLDPAEPYSVDTTYLPPVPGPIVQAAYPDLNGDGLADFVFCAADSAQVNVHDGMPPGYAGDTKITVDENGAPVVHPGWDWNHPKYITLPHGRWYYAVRTADGSAPQTHASSITCGVDDPLVLVDWNGDGLQDVLTVKAHVGNVNGAPVKAAPQTWGEYQALQIDLATHTVALAATGLPVDLLQRFAAEQVYGEPALAIDHTNTSRVPWGAGGLGFDRRGDFNGDGLTDLARLELDTGDTADNLAAIRLVTTHHQGPGAGPDYLAKHLVYRVYWNTGAGFVRGAAAHAIGSWLETKHSASAVLKSFLSGVSVDDTDQDGRDDLRACQSSTKILEEEFDLDYGCRTYSVDPLDAGYKYSHHFVVPGSSDGVAPIELREAASLDVNDDGLSDMAVLYRWRGAGENEAKNRLSWAVFPHLGQRADLLTFAVDGVGRSVSFGYSSMADESVVAAKSSIQGFAESEPSYPATRTKSSRPIVARLTESTGVPAVGKITHYTYADPRSDRFGRGFLGFGLIHASFSNDQFGFEEHRWVRAASRAWDPKLRDYPRTGSPEIVLGGAEYDFSPPEPNGPTPNDLRATAATLEEHSHAVIAHDDGRYTPYEASARITDYAFSSSACPIATLCGADYANLLALPSLRTTQRITEELDPYGNVVRGRTVVPGRTLAVERTVENQGSPRLLGLVTHELTTETLGDGTTTVRESQTTHNALGALHQVTREPNDPALYQRSTYLYDDHGNLASVAVHGTNPLEVRFATTAWDADGVFPETQTNAFGHVQTTHWRPGLGVVDWHEDPNQVRTSIYSDGFGRPGYVYTSKLGFDLGTGVATTYERKKEYDETLYYTIVTRTTDQGLTTMDKLDPMGRVVKTRAMGFDGVLADTHQEYDSFGRLVRRSQPVAANAQPGAGDWTELLYDQLGRPRKTTSPDGTVTQVLYGGNLDPLTTWTIDGRGHWSRSRVNLRGQVRSTVHGVASWEHAYASKALPEELCFSYGKLGTLTRTEQCQLEGVDPDDLGEKPWTGPHAKTMGYDGLGRRIALHDEALGTRTYTYTVFDELETATDAKGRVVRMKYDALGRPDRREVWNGDDLEGAAAWDWDTQLLGKLSRTQSETGNTVEHVYDFATRPWRTIYGVHGETFALELGYDAANRVQRIEYPDTGLSEAPFAVRLEYDAHGVLRAIRDEETQDALWTRVETNLRGQTTKEQWGNGLETVRVFHPQNGTLKQIRTGLPAAAPIQDSQYWWDGSRNLIGRWDAIHGQLEELTYDEKDRLHTATVTKGGQSASRQFDYDPWGNLTQRSDLGSYTYNSKKQVTGVGSLGYTYDANGNLATRTSPQGAIELEFNGFDKLLRITGDEPNAAIDLDYDIDHNRVWRRSAQDQSETVTVGGLYERQTFHGTEPATVHKYLVSDGERVIASVHRKVSPGDVASTRQVQYLHGDHLGSPEVVTTDAPVHAPLVVERLSFDPWGARRNASDWTSVGPGGIQNPALQVGVMNVGFTGHTRALDDGFVNMRGRMYDPVTARFVSPDPLIQSSFDLRSHNRYSYVWNRPLSGTDPSGYVADIAVAGIVLGVVAIVASVAGATAGIVNYCQSGGCELATSPSSNQAGHANDDGGPKKQNKATRKLEQTSPTARAQSAGDPGAGPRYRGVESMFSKLDQDRLPAIEKSFAKLNEGRSPAIEKMFEKFNAPRSPVMQMVDELNVPRYRGIEAAFDRFDEVARQMAVTSWTSDLLTIGNLPLLCVDTFSKLSFNMGGLSFAFGVGGAVYGAGVLSYWSSLSTTGKTGALVGFWGSLVGIAAYILDAEAAGLAAEAAEIGLTLADLGAGAGGFAVWGRALGWIGVFITLVPYVGPFQQHMNDIGYRPEMHPGNNY